MSVIGHVFKTSPADGMRLQRLRMAAGRSVRLRVVTEDGPREAEVKVISVGAVDRNGDRVDENVEDAFSPYVLVEWEGRRHRYPASRITHIDGERL